MHPLMEKAINRAARIIRDSIRSAKLRGEDSDSVEIWRLRVLHGKMVCLCVFAECRMAFVPFSHLADRAADDQADYPLDEAGGAVLQALFEFELAPIVQRETTSRGEPIYRLFADADPHREFAKASQHFEKLVP